MLLLNGKEFNTTTAGVGQEIQHNHYKESVQRIHDLYGKKGFNDAVTIKNRKEITFNRSGLQDIIPPILIPAKAYCRIQFAKVDDKKKDQLGGSEEWAFTRQRPKRKDDRYEPDPRSIMLDYLEVFSLKNDIDLLYFLLYKSPAVYFTDAVVNHGKPKMGQYIIDDASKKAQERLLREREEIEVKAQILANDNKYPLHNDSELRRIASAWGIGEAMSENTEVEIIRLALYDNVMQLQKNKESSGIGKGIQEFYDLIKQDDAVQVRSLIGYAIDNKLIHLDNKVGAFVYDVNGEIIVQVPPRQRGENMSFDYLYNYLTDPLNGKYLDMFLREVVSEEYLKGITFENVKWFAKKINLRMKGKSGEVLIGEILKYYNGEEVDLKPEEVEET